MSNSALATSRYPAHPNNYTQGRSKPISKITIHHMAGVLTAAQCGAIFQDPNRAGSSNYGVGINGDIAVYVDEANTPWTDSNWDSNCRSVTIETSDSARGGNWPVSDVTLNALIRLVADIAKRNNLGRLVKGQNLTWHSMYTNTDCPGAYLLSKMDYIASEANKINYPEPTPAPTPSPSSGFNIGDKVIINGPLYVSSDAANPAGSVTNKVTVITRKNPGSAHPYNTTDDLGWMDESSIKLYSEPSSNELKVGDRVKITGQGNGSAYGDSGIAYGLGWERQILKIYPEQPYPYQVGDSTGTTGFYKKDSLQKL